MFKRSVVIRAGKFKAPAIKLDYKTVIFFTLLLCGVLFGVMLSRKGSPQWHVFFNTFVNNHIATKATSSVFRNFCSIFFCFFVIVLFDYICGLCGVGAPFLYMTPVILGVYCGVVISQYYCLYKLSGLVYCIMVNIPCYAIAAATLIKCCCYSSDISKEIFVYLVNGRNDSKEKILYNYTVRYLIMCIPIVIGSLLSSVNFKLFSGLFEFI